MKRAIVAILMTIILTSIVWGMIFAYSAQKQMTYVFSTCQNLRYALDDIKKDAEKAENEEVVKKINIVIDGIEKLKSNPNLDTDQLDGIVRKIKEMEFPKTPEELGEEANPFQRR